MSSYQLENAVQIGVRNIIVMGNLAETLKEVFDKSGSLSDDSEDISESYIEAGKEYEITAFTAGRRQTAMTLRRKTKVLYGPTWSNRLLAATYPYVYFGGIFLRCQRGDSFEIVSARIALGVDKDGYREIIGYCEGGWDDKESWLAFLHNLKDRGLSGMKLSIGDRAPGFVAALTEVFPESTFQNCVADFYRNIVSDIPLSKVREVAAMLKSIHSMEDIDSSRTKAKGVIDTLCDMKLLAAANHLEQGIEDAIAFMNFPHGHWSKIRTNNGLKQIMQEIHGRSRAVGCRHSAPMWVDARMRDISTSNRGKRRYLNIPAQYDDSPEFSVQADYTDSRISM